MACRAPRGARGLKSFRTRTAKGGLGSGSARGPWIEIYLDKKDNKWHPSRAPRGARGLKSSGPGRPRADLVSGSARGPWIEIPPSVSTTSHPAESGSARGPWIEIRFCLLLLCCNTSGSARGPWIEMSASNMERMARIVGLREGPVD